MTICRYLDITSSTRDRTQYPNPFDFQVTYTNAPIPTNPRDISDSYAPSIGYNGDDFAVVGAPNTSNTQILGTTAGGVAGSYIGEYLDIYQSNGTLLERHTVIDYNSTTRTVTVTPNFNLPGAAFPGITYYYLFRHAIPLASYTVGAAGSTTSSVVVDSVIANANSYVGMWLQSGQFTPADLSNQPKRIVSVNINTLASQTTFNLEASADLAYDPPTFLSAAPSAGSVFYISNIVSNWEPLVYNGTTVGTQVPRCYNLDLCDMIISNSQIVYGALGGAISTYPYIYLEIQAESQKTNNILVSNNQHSKKALFKIPTSSDMITSFINLRSCTSQTIKFKPNDTFSFRFLKPNGEVLRWILPDDLAPFLPNQTLQLSFTIRFCPTQCVEDV